MGTLPLSKIHHEYRNLASVVGSGLTHTQIIPSETDPNSCPLKKGPV